MSSDLPLNSYVSQVQGVYFLPIIHHRVEFAERIRWAVDQLKPDVLAVELPRSLSAAYRRAVSRLPEISVITYQTAQGPPYYLLVEPTAPLAEAVRYATENGLGVSFVDVDVDYHCEHHDPVPDTYAVRHIGLRAYFEAFQQAAPEQSAHPLDTRRENGMAYYLRELSAQGRRVLFVCGMAHAARVEAALQEPQAAPLGYRRRKNVRVFNLHPDSVREVAGEIPFLQVVYELSRQAVRPQPPLCPAPRPRLVDSTLRVIEGGAMGSLDQRERNLRDAESTARRWLEDALPGSGFDRHWAQERIVDLAVERYTQRRGELRRWQLEVMSTFSRRYAYFTQRLVPDLFQLLTAARGAVNEAFAYELWELATSYPFQREVSDLPTVRIAGGELWTATRRLALKPRTPARKEGRWTPQRRMRSPSRTAFGKRVFASDAICSHLPEDARLADFGRFLRRKALSVISDERVSVRPFGVSMLDGIDMRETIRNWHKGTIFVRELLGARDKVANLVMIFDADEEDLRYPFKTMWRGENEQQSDMAFYATPVERELVGPGIARCEYGGFMLAYPPKRIADVWEDQDYSAARSKAETLLMAALDYADERYVVYVASSPPRGWFHSLAKAWNKRILFIPIGQLSPVALNQLRVFHILADKERREGADDYIW